MNIDMPVGRYVVAVSGGVDSMVLLDLLAQRSNLDLVVAHFDHGIRPDSDLDKRLVQQRAKHYGLQFVYDKGYLGDTASEDQARKARYEFLHQVRGAANAQAIVTAHHQDDLLETAVLNMLRGTGRRGLSSLQSTDVIKRPLLHVPKSELRRYAENNKVTWREDKTNQDTKYLRNYIRHIILPKLSKEQQNELLEHIKAAQRRNKEIDNHLVTHLHIQPAHNTLDRHYFIMLPHAVAMEVMTAWLKKHMVKNIDRKLVTKLVQIAKTSPPNRVVDVDKKLLLRINRDVLALEPRDR